MHGTSKAVKKTALYAPMKKQLPDIFQSVHGVLHGLRRKAVHQISVNQHARLRKPMRHPGHLVYCHPFLHQCEQSVTGYFQAARHGDATTFSQQLGKVWREGFLKANIAPPRYV